MNRVVGIFLFLAAFLVVSGMSTHRWKTIRWTVESALLKVDGAYPRIVVHLSLRGNETTINGQRVGPRESYDEQARKLEEIRGSSLSQSGNATQEDRILAESLSEAISWRRRADAVGHAAYIACFVGALILAFAGLLLLFCPWLKQEITLRIRRWSQIASMVAAVVVAAATIAFVALVDVRLSARLAGHLSTIDPAMVSPPQFNRSLGYSFYLCIAGSIVVPGVHLIAWWHGRRARWAKLQTERSPHKRSQRS